MGIEERLNEAREAARRLAAASWLPGLVTPDYAGSCIANLPGAIEELLAGAGARSRTSLPGLLSEAEEGKWSGAGVPSSVPFPSLGPAERARRVVLIVLDAFGFELFLRTATELPSLRRLIERGRVAPLTSVFPSTTNVALTSLYTGMAPAAHGIVGHLVYLREFGLVANLLQFRAVGDSRPETLRARGLEPRAFFPVTTIFERLAAAGVRGAAVTRQAFVGSSLATLHHAGAQIHPYLAVSDLCVTLRRLLAQGEAGPRFIFGYWDMIDTLSHRFGPESEEVMAEVAAFFAVLERELLEALPPAARRDTLCLITADHGQVSLPGDGGVPLEEHPELTDCLMLPPTGSSRQPYLHAAPGRADALRDYFTCFDGAFHLLDRRVALERGLFGPGALHSELPHRVGDYLAVARKDACLWRADTPLEVRRYRGIHSGLTEPEMLVPLLAVPLDDAMA